MKVAIYTGTFTKDRDGAAKSLYELTDSLLENNIQVAIWSPDITPGQKNGLKLYKIPSVPLPIYPDYRISLPNHKLKTQITRFEPDILHITVPDMAGVYLVRFARRMGIPVLTSYHTDFPSYLKSYHLGFLDKSVWRFFKWFYNESRVVLAPSETMIHRLEAHHIQSIRLWSRGIHSDKYNPSFRSQSLRALWGAVDKKVILYCGRFVWYKDLETFIRVYEQFKEHGPGNVKFVLAGDGPIRDELERRMPDAVFTGYLHGEELSRVYAASDIFLFPSSSEAFGNVVLEALSSGLPAVVSDVGGCREIVEKSGAGLVVKAGNAALFYESCKLLLENPLLYRRFRRSGLKYAADRSWVKINRRVIDEYRRLCA
ncbi:MAG: glycosyltransferase family 1 protein [bacterium]|nr:glycosyltransferase family 1 protein [bacterium]